MNGCTASAGEVDLASVKEPVNKWIISEYNDAITKTSSAIDAYRFNEAADSLYQFIWHSYCDWYVELIKPQLADEARETRAVAATILAGAVKLLHPFMPYLTEELNEKIFGSSDLMIAAAWPAPVVQANGDAVEDLRFVIRLISDIRYLRAEMNVPLSGCWCYSPRAERRPTPCDKRPDAGAAAPCPHQRCGRG